MTLPDVDKLAPIHPGEVRTNLAWRAVATTACAQWLAVSVFEAVIDLPRRVADAPAVGAFGKGSPARYHVLAAPVILGSSAGALLTSRRDGPGNGTLVAGTAVTVSAAALTGVAIGTVNVPLLEGNVRAEEKDRLVRRWHRLNAARVVLIAAGVTLSVASAHRAFA